MKMVEKMARAMAVHARVSEDIGWRVYAGHARAALAALSEPTKDMVLAAEKAGWDDANCMPAINMHAVAFRAAIQEAIND